MCYGIVCPVPALVRQAETEPTYLVYVPEHLAPGLAATETQVAPTWLLELLHLSERTKETLKDFTTMVAHSFPSFQTSVLGCS
jgi:hypothetical protein